MEPVLEILGRPDEVPVLIFDSVGDSGKVVTPRIVSSKENPKYVAISYVASQGLANPFSNALPNCQLQRLHRLCWIMSEVSRENPEEGEMFSPQVGVWIDTLSRSQSPKGFQPQPQSHLLTMCQWCQ
jgi:hypothetical protein